MNRFLRLICSAFLAAALLGACGATPSGAPTSTAAEQPSATIMAAPTTAPTAAATVAPTQAAAGPLNDAAGRPVQLAGVPQRIVSLAPSTTELAYAIDLGPRLVAVDDFSNYPAEAQNLPKIGGSNGAYNFEQIVALKPDLVLAAGITAPEAIQKLEELKLPVVVLGSPETTFESILADIRLLGMISGQRERAEQVVLTMQTRLEEIKFVVARATTRPKVFWELDATDPSKPFTVGPGNFVDEIINIAGGQNIFASAASPFPQVSAEQIVAANPDIIILADANYGMTAEMVAARPGWEALAAIQAKQVLPVDDDLVSRPGPRVIDGIEAVARLIHPELFK